jgi:hypothetical protein
MLCLDLFIFICQGTILILFVTLNDIENHAYLSTCFACFMLIYGGCQIFVPYFMYLSMINICPMFIYVSTIKKIPVFFTSYSSNNKYLFSGLFYISMTNIYLVFFVYNYQGLIFCFSFYFSCINVKYLSYPSILLNNVFVCSYQWYIYVLC